MKISAKQENERESKGIERRLSEKDRRPKCLRKLNGVVSLVRGYKLGTKPDQSLRSVF